MSEHDVVQEWLLIAYEDYDAAQYLFDNKCPKPLTIICYHCQQSAEKSLKAFLCASGVDIPKTHEIGLLCRCCYELNESFADFFVDCEELEIYATNTRYPSRIEIDEPHAKRALRQAITVYNHVTKQVQQVFSE